VGGTKTYLDNELKDRETIVAQESELRTETEDKSETELALIRARIEERVAASWYRESELQDAIEVDNTLAPGFYQLMPIPNLLGSFSA